MQRFGLLAALAGAIMLSALSACASPPPPTLPTPTATSRQAVVALPMILAEPQRWSGQPLIVIAPPPQDEDGRILQAQPIAMDQAPSTADPSSAALWLAEPLSPAVRQALTASDAALKLEGRLSPPGAYGPEQRFAYQFVASAAAVVQPERTTLLNLAQNPRALDNILLTVEGVLLVQPDAALLVDQVNAGGLPQAGGSQIKLLRSALPPSIELAQRSGAVQWGSIRIVGWWQDGVLIPLSIRVLDAP